MPVTSSNSHKKILERNVSYEGQAIRHLFRDFKVDKTLLCQHNHRRVKIRNIRGTKASTQHFAERKRPKFSFSTTSETLVPTFQISETPNLSLVLLPCLLKVLHVFLQ